MENENISDEKTKLNDNLNDLIDEIEKLKSEN